MFDIVNRITSAVTPAGTGLTCSPLDTPSDA
jgi:hypothetical protein